MCEMSDDRFVSWVQNFVELRKYDARVNEEKMITSMTGVMAKQVMAAHEFRDSIPKIKAALTVQMPVWRMGELVLLDKGYNAEEEIYVVQDVPKVEDKGLEWAVAEFEELFGQFPLDGERSKAALVSYGVGLFSRYLFDDDCAVPMFQFTANMEGAGKSIVAKAGIIAVYGSSGSSAYGDGDKFKEMLNSVASSKKGYVFFDDMTGSLFNQDLNRWVTDSTWEYRLFHTQKLGRVKKNCMTIVTDNGCTLSDDLIRRSVIVSFAAEERAADRQEKLKMDMTEKWLKTNAARSRVLSVWWSMMCHWSREGMMKAPKKIPSFSDWSDVVGGVVAAAGMGNAFEAAGLMSGGDKRRTEIDLLLAAVVEEYEPDDGGKIELLLSGFCAVARENSLFEYELGELHLVRQKMDSNPGRYYDHPGDGLQLDDTIRNMQALVWMDPHKNASPFSRRLRKYVGMKFNIGGAVWVLSAPGGRVSKYVLECIEPF